MLNQFYIDLTDYGEYQIRLKCESKEDAQQKLEKMLEWHKALTHALMSVEEAAESLMFYQDKYK